MAAGHVRQRPPKRRVVVCDAIALPKAGSPKASWKTMNHRRIQGRYDMRPTSLTSITQWVSRLTLAILLAWLVTAPAIAQVTLTCPSDLTVSNDPGVCSAVVNFPEPSVTGTDATAVVTITPASGSTFPVGTNAVDVTVTAGTNVLASCSFTIMVLDTEPPVITNAAPSRSVLWPPNHKMVAVTVDYDDTDNCDPAPESALSVTS